MNNVVEFEHTVLKDGEKSDQEWINEGVGLRTRAERTMRDVGLWYIGVQESREGARKDILSGDQITSAEICASAGFDPSVPPRYAQFVKTFPTVESQRGFGIEQCKAMLPACRKLGFDEFHNRFMSDAVTGVAYKSDPDPDYKYTGPWTTEQIVRQVKIVTGKQIAVDSGTIEKTKTDLLGKVDSALSGTVAKSKQKKVKEAVAAEIKAVNKDLNEKFHDEVNAKAKEIAAELPEVRDAATAKRSFNTYKKKYETKAKIAEARMDGLPIFMSKDDYRLILNCLHPDRAPEDRKDRFQRAFDIFKTLEKGVDWS